MIQRIFSSLPTFKSLEFTEGLNVVVARKEVGASARQTRNRAGKSSLVEIIHFLMGAEAKPDSMFRSDALLRESFGMTFGLRGKPITVERAGAQMAKIRVEGAQFLSSKTTLTKTEWVHFLGEKVFGLSSHSDAVGQTPSFRSLFAYFARRQSSEGFTKPEKQATMQQTGDFQVALLFLLGLDWEIAREWQKVRDREKMLDELKKAAGAGALGTIIGKAADLRTQVAVADAALHEMRNELAGFRVLPQYAQLEAEADNLTRRINELANENVIDAAAIRDLEHAINSELPPPLDELASVYAEAGIALPGVTIKRYDEVRSFHESVVRNRREYLSEELNSARQRVAGREYEKQGLDVRRSEVMGVLQAHGALEQFAKLQAASARKEAEVESLRQRFQAAEQLEGTKNELEIERNRLTLRLRRDFAEQNQRLSDAIIAFEETSKRLYESAGSMMVEETANGPVFQFPMQGSSSKGIKNMQIFCFDMMLMRLCTKRGIGPGFLVHDSHLFDGVDGRQVVSALKLGAELAQELGFQYIVTMNEDDAFKETIEGFDLKQYVLPVVLTDARDDGGLFGIRF